MAFLVCLACYLALFYLAELPDLRLPSGEPMRRIHIVAFVFEPLRQRTTLFGGVTLSGYYNDMWEWDGLDWTQIYANPPSARGFCSAAYDGANQRIAIFGGMSGPALNELWFFQYASQWPDEICDNGLDDDTDTVTDCADPDCDGKPCGTNPNRVCQGGSCVP